jgi:hypothetical protein
MFVYPANNPSLIGLNRWQPPLWAGGQLNGRFGELPPRERLYVARVPCKRDACTLSNDLTVSAVPEGWRESSPSVEPWAAVLYLAAFWPNSARILELRSTAQIR